MTRKPEGSDYPFYNDKPTELGWPDWLIVLAALAAGFAQLSVLPRIPGLDLMADTFLRAILFVALPLAALAWRAGSGWRALFNGWRWSYLGWGLAIGVLNLVFTFVIGRLALRYFDLAVNGIAGPLKEGSVAGGLPAFFAHTGIQLLGEELVTIIPFLFLLWLGVRKLGMGRTPAILMAWIGSAVLFGALHLPTYGWNVLQVLLLIGPVRLVLTYAYMRTKSIWASTIAHIFNDWSMFTLLIVLGGAAR